MGEQMFAMKSKVFGRPSIVNDEVAQCVDHRICKRWRFTISELPCEFPQISSIILYEIIALG
jgi:hypothetical protein